MKLSSSRISNQIQAITITTSIIAAVLMFLGAVLINVIHNKAMFEGGVDHLAVMIAKNSHAVFDAVDSVSAERQIQSLIHAPAIVRAELKHADGQLLAFYQKENASPNSISSFFLGPITAHQSISRNNQYLGSLKITASPEMVILISVRFAIISALVLLLSIGVAICLAYFFQKRISNPIKKLHTAINRVTHSSDDFFQLPIETKDSMGDIYESFNAMLTELAERNKAVERHAQELGATLVLRNEQISEEEHKRILWLQNLARFLQHELKNTMLGFRSSLDMIERRTDDEKIHQYIERARNSIIFMGKLLHNVGETSGLEAELLAEDFAPLNLSETIGAWLKDYHYLTGVNTINYSFDDNCFIQGNSIRIMQMVEKLAANAASHSIEDSQIELSVCKFQHEVVLSVANQGTPLPEERGGIFELFVSMRENDQKTSDNVGLGLYIVRVIAQAHDGYVEADDLENAQGAVFRVHLPRYDPD